MEGWFQTWSPVHQSSDVSPLCFHIDADTNKVDQSG